MKLTVYLCHNLQDKRTTQLWLQKRVHVVWAHAPTCGCTCTWVWTRVHTCSWSKQIKLHQRCTGEEKLCFGVRQWVQQNLITFSIICFIQKGRFAEGIGVWLPSQGEIPLLKEAQAPQQSDAVLRVIISLASFQTNKYNRVASANFKSKKPIPKMCGQTVVLCHWRSKGKVFMCCARVSHGSGADWGQCQDLPQTYCPGRGFQCPVGLTFAYI